VAGEVVLDEEAGIEAELLSAKRLLDAVRELRRLVGCLRPLNVLEEAKLHLVATRI
jgi:hypothetical protein